MNRSSALIAAVAVPLLADHAAAEALILPKAGLAIEWRQDLPDGRRTGAHQEVVSVNSPIVIYREMSETGPSRPVEYETWRGLVLIKRRLPETAAFTEASVSFALDVSALEALLPLVPGRRALLAVSGRTELRLGFTPTAPSRRSELRGDLAIAVEGREAVTVPAGRFDTMVIRHDLTLEEGDARRVTLTTRIWFAVALGWPVKKHQLGAKGEVEAEALVFSITRR